MLEACALLSDLEILEDGDESEIGERGVRGYESVHETVSNLLLCRSTCRVARKLEVCPPPSLCYLGALLTLFLQFPSLVPYTRVLP